MRKTIIKNSNLNIIKRHLLSSTPIFYKIFNFLTFINIIFSINFNNKISIKIISSGDSGILLNELYIPDEMIINNKTVEFNNTIVPSGQSITLIWNNLDNCCEGMFFINKNILNNHTNSIIEEINLSEFDPNYIKTMKK